MTEEKGILTIGSRVLVYRWDTGVSMSGPHEATIMNIRFYWRVPFQDSDLFCEFQLDDGSIFSDVYYHIEGFVTQSATVPTASGHA